MPTAGVDEGQNKAPIFSFFGVGLKFGGLSMREKLYFSGDTGNNFIQSLPGRTSGTGEGI